MSAELAPKGLFFAKFRKVRSHFFCKILYSSKAPSEKYARGSGGSVRPSVRPLYLLLRYNQEEALYESTILRYDGPEKQWIPQILFSVFHFEKNVFQRRSR